MKLNKIGEVWNSANRLLSDFIGLLSSKNFATMATWRNDFSSLFHLYVSEKNNGFLHFVGNCQKLFFSIINDRLFWLFSLPVNGSIDLGHSCLWNSTEMTLQWLKSRKKDRSQREFHFRKVSFVFVSLRRGCQQHREIKTGKLWYSFPLPMGITSTRTCWHFWDFQVSFMNE